jgi:GxxExxY protein
MNHEGHDDREGHEHPVWDKFHMRVASPLTPEAELVMTQTIGCALAVHRALGPGFLESIYRKAMRIELESRNLAYECERKITVNYRGVQIDGQRVDLIIEGLIVVELKSVIRLDDVHSSQLVSYLRTTGLRGGLLINFRVSRLQQGSPSSGVVKKRCS